MKVHVQLMTLTNNDIDNKDIIPFEALIKIWQIL